MNTELVRELSPGVKSLVVWLNEHGFETCDSGDGTNHAAGMGCAVPFPMIAISVEPSKLQLEADRLHKLLTEHGVDFTPREQPDHRDHAPIHSVDQCEACSVDANYPQIAASYDPNDGSAVIVLYNILSSDVAGCHAS
jgi:hypothetical protein